MKKRIWIDLETTGLNYEKDTITELALLYEELDEKGNTIKKSKLHEYCLPDKKPKDFHVIEELTGITWEFLEKQGIPEEDLFNKLIEFLDSRINRFNKEDKAFFLAYNAPFDAQFIRELFKRFSKDQVFFGNYFYHIPIDIMGVTALCCMLGLVEIPENFKNLTVGKHLGIKEATDLKAHSAINDIKISRHIQLTLQNKLKEWSKNVS